MPDYFAQTLKEVQPAAREDAAGVLAVEGFGERLLQRGLLREADEHARPRDGLEQRPVQPHREGHGQNHG